MSLSDEAIKCVQKPKTNSVSLVSLDLNTIEQLLDELWRRIQNRSVQPRNVRQLQVALHDEWAWHPKNVVQHHMLLVRPHYDAVIAAGEGQFHFDLDENEIFILKRKTCHF